MSKPVVSVILPVYNGENYLRFAIESVLGQTFQDFELIVVDDGSKDTTPEIARSYGARVRYVRQDNTGVAGAFNHGLRLAAGRYISWLSHDDVFLEEKLARQVSLLSQSAAPAACYTDIQVINSRGVVTAEQRLPEHSRGEVLRNILTCGPICSASYSIMYDRRCIDEVGMYTEAWRYTQDAEMLMRLARRFPLLHVPEVLMQVRDHGDRGVRSRNWEREVVRFFREQINGLPLAELFPALGPRVIRPERGRGYQSLGDAFAVQSFPLYQVAFSLYWRSLRENPANVRWVLPRLVRLSWRHLSEGVSRARAKSS